MRGESLEDESWPSAVVNSHLDARRHTHAHTHCHYITLMAQNYVVNYFFITFFFNFFYHSPNGNLLLKRESLLLSGPVSHTLGTKILYVLWRRPLLFLKCFSSLPFIKVRLIEKGNRLAAHFVMEGQQAHHVTTALGTDCDTKLQKQHNPFKVHAGVHGQSLPSDSCMFSHSKDTFCFFILNGLGLLKK